MSGTPIEITVRRSRGEKWVAHVYNFGRYRYGWRRDFGHVAADSRYNPTIGGEYLSGGGLKGYAGQLNMEMSIFTRREKYCGRRGGLGGELGISGGRRIW